MRRQWKALRPLRVRLSNHPRSFLRHEGQDRVFSALRRSHDFGSRLPMPAVRYYLDHHLAVFGYMQVAMDRSELDEAIRNVRRDIDVRLLPAALRWHRLMRDRDDGLQ